jgi:hypothetical protein
LPTNGKRAKLASKRTKLPGLAIPLLSQEVPTPCDCCWVKSTKPLLRILVREFAWRKERELGAGKGAHSERMVARSSLTPKSPQKLGYFWIGGNTPEALSTLD